MKLTYSLIYVDSAGRLLTREGTVCALCGATQGATRAEARRFIQGPNGKMVCECCIDVAQDIVAIDRRVEARHRENEFQIRLRIRRLECMREPPIRIGKGK